MQTLLLVCAACGRASNQASKQARPFCLYPNSHSRLALALMTAAFTLGNCRGMQEAESAAAARSFKHSSVVSRESPRSRSTAALLLLLLHERQAFWVWDYFFLVFLFRVVGRKGRGLQLRSNLLRPRFRRAVSCVSKRSW